MTKQMMEHTLLDRTTCNYVSLQESQKNKLDEFKIISRNFRLAWFQIIYYLNGIEFFDYSLPYAFSNLNRFFYFLTDGTWVLVCEIRKGIVTVCNKKPSCDNHGL